MSMVMAVTVHYVLFRSPTSPAPVVSKASTSCIELPSSITC